MIGKPLVSPVEVYVSAANASEETKSKEGKSRPAARSRKSVSAPTVEKKAKVKAKSRQEKESAASVPVMEFGVFRCQVCDYRLTVLPGSAKPLGGWRCPIDFASLIFVSASY